jgi:hypothetical protein
MLQPNLSPREGSCSVDPSEGDFAPENLHLNILPAFFAV